MRHIGRVHIQQRSTQNVEVNQVAFREIRGTLMRRTKSNYRILSAIWQVFPIHDEMAHLVDYLSQNLQVDLEAASILAWKEVLVSDELLYIAHEQTFGNFCLEY
jgi:hypothetical protein